MCDLRMISGVQCTQFDRFLVIILQITDLRRGLMRPDMTWKKLPLLLFCGLIVELLCPRSEI